MRSIHKLFFDIGLPLESNMCYTMAWKLLSREEHRDMGT